MCRLDVQTLRALNEFFTAKTALRPPDASSVPEGNATHALRGLGLRGFGVRGLGFRGLGFPPGEADGDAEGSHLLPGDPTKLGRKLGRHLGVFGLRASGFGT